MTSEEKWLLEEKYGGKETEAYKADKERLAKGEPLAYVIGSQPFLGLTIYLDSRPLIPRPETEWWTEQLLTEIGSRMRKVWPAEHRSDRRPEDFPKTVTDFRFLDLCAGSGAIGCAALAKLPNAEVYFGEIEPAHKSTIEKNIKENNLDERRAFVQIGDLFEPFKNMTFDVIAINPPYIPEGRILEKSVTEFEPHKALYSGEDGLELMRKIAKELPYFLNKDGVAWIECDSARAVATRELFAEQKLSATLRTDQYGVERLLVVSLSA